MPHQHGRTGKRLLGSIEHCTTGILHWSDAGVASWYDFAAAIGEIGEQIGLLETAAEVHRSAELPTPAPRPSYSLLDCTATRTRPSARAIGVTHSTTRSLTAKTASSS